MKTLTEYTKQEKANEESLKLGYDLFKHVTTLSTGTLLILITFLEKLFQNPVWKILVSISFVSLTLVIILSIILMFMITAGVGELGELQERQHKINFWIFIFTIISFVIGILSFVMFALVNFNR
jgi:hypothetical protein